MIEVFHLCHIHQSCKRILTNETPFAIHKASVRVSLCTLMVRAQSARLFVAVIGRFVVWICEIIASLQQTATATFTLAIRKECIIVGKTGGGGRGEGGKCYRDMEHGALRRSNRRATIGFIYCGSVVKCNAYAIAVWLSNLIYIMFGARKNRNCGSRLAWRGARKCNYCGVAASIRRYVLFLVIKCSVSLQHRCWMCVCLLLVVVFGNQLRGSALTIAYC